MICRQIFLSDCRKLRSLKLVVPTGNGEHCIVSILGSQAPHILRGCCPVYLALSLLLRGGLWALSSAQCCHASEWTPVFRLYLLISGIPRFTALIKHAHGAECRAVLPGVLGPALGPSRENLARATDSTRFCLRFGP